VEHDVTFQRPPVDDEATEMRDRVDNFDATEASMFHLVVMGEGVFTQFPLTRGRDVTIGRGGLSDVRLNDRKASRHHARLHVGDKLLLEDLGSTNGTGVRDSKLAPRERREIAPGEPIAIGSTTLMVQRKWTRAKEKALMPHGYFEQRLEEECARAERTNSSFAVVRLKLEKTQGEVGASAVVGELRASDVLARYGPDDLEILLVDTAPAASAGTVNRIVEQLGKRGITARAGAACFPRDGRTPAALVSRACAAVRGTDMGGIPLVLNDESMRRLHGFAERMAQGNISVLIIGETGVGKEILAETIHRSSPRNGKPYVRLNCAAFADTLAESELFGYERGAFTGAAQAKPGLLETAEGGTVFLDEVGELSLVLQGKILRVLETHEVVRVGGLKPKKIDVRFVAATNRDLESAVLAGTFRRDLYFRLNGATLAIPPLRERKAEIVPFAESFASQVCEQLERKPPSLSTEAKRMLETYSWPGNVRELKNVIERAVLLCVGEEVTAEHLSIKDMGEVLQQSPPVLEEAPPSEPEEDDNEFTPFATTISADLRNEQRAKILDALAKCAGNQSRAAKLLGISRGTLLSRLDALRIARPRK
jgi:DNA-binding NtrC family response regulator